MLTLAQWKDLKRGRRARRYAGSPALSLGLQIAPVVSLVAILMYVWMAAYYVEPDRILVLQLADGGCGGRVPEEVIVAIGDDGQIYLNEEPSDSPPSKDLPELAGNLLTLKRAAEDSQSKLLVAIHADELAEFQRVVDVLDVLVRTEIDEVSFQAGDPD